jgi:hypothetical protein
MGRAEGYLRAAADEFASSGAAESAGSTGDDDDLASHVVTSPLRLNVEHNIMTVR